MTDKFNHILEHFPTIDHAFAYGSGVFGQPGLYDRVRKAGKQPMIDFVFAVRDPVRWHQEVRCLSMSDAESMAGLMMVCLQNIARNPAHYSFLSACGPRVVCFRIRLQPTYMPVVVIRCVICRYNGQRIRLVRAFIIILSFQLDLRYVLLRAHHSAEGR